MGRHPHDCDGPGACAGCDDVVGRREARRDDVEELAPASDPRSQFGDVRDYNWPRGFGGDGSVPW